MLYTWPVMLDAIFVVLRRVLLVIYDVNFLNGLP